MSLAAIQQVELVGGESWWSHNFGSLLIGLAAIIAAGLAAYVAVRNHNQQLTHDREVRDRDATRQAIDNAVRGMSDFILHGVTLSGHIRTLEAARAGLEEIDSSNAQEMALQQREVDAAHAEIQKVIPRLSAAINTVHADTIHLAIRVGKEHPLTTAQTETREALKGWVLVLNQGWSHNRTKEELQAAADGKKAFRGARSKFESACFSWMTSSS